MRKKLAMFKVLPGHIYQPRKGAAVYCTPPISNPNLVNAGKGTHFRSNLAKAVPYRGWRIWTSLRRFNGSSAITGRSPSAIVTIGRRSHRPFVPGGSHPSSMMAFVNWTFIGSPIIEPSFASYYNFHHGSDQIFTAKNIEQRHLLLQTPALDGSRSLALCCWLSVAGIQRLEQAVNRRYKY